ncbi:uncharacterized protein LOC131854089 [Achroia grisella]|uniref:uncharacterized protein LOC131854089 n=1 Tax=Achroia grisella TaxID=688607 RepID=UPI0027D3462D|nr:uncharacterized protein LOC131854089 [Achroia grisella]
MGLKAFDIAALILNLIHCVYSDHILSCNVSAIHQCPEEHKFCNEKTGQCECLQGFTLVEKHCEPSESALTTRHTATAAIVTIFTLALVICGLVLVVRRYNLIEYIRQKINLRRNNDVMYEDVMIGQDDPPLSP